jgi:hypothetical protein
MRLLGYGVGESRDEKMAYLSDNIFSHVKYMGGGDRKLFTLTLRIYSDLFTGGI